MHLTQRVVSVMEFWISLLCAIKVTACNILQLVAPSSFLNERQGLLATKVIHSFVDLSILRVSAFGSQLTTLGIRSHLECHSMGSNVPYLQIRLIGER